MRLFKVSFFPLVGEDSVAVGRAMAFATVSNPLMLRDIVNKAASDGVLPKEFKDAPVSIEEEIEIPQGMAMYSVTVGLPPGGVSFCFGASSKQHLKEVLTQALIQMGNEDLSRMVEYDAWTAREIDLNKEGLW